MGSLSASASWATLAWSAATVGRASQFDVYQHGHFSVLEVSWRLGMLYANVAMTSGGALDRSPAYGRLDPSEKGAVSFFLGMTFTKWAAGALMDTPWLLHLDLYATNVAKGVRPDFLGQDTVGGWSLFESKGRSGPVDRAAMTRAKAQTQQIGSVNGSPPVLRVASQSAFPSGHHRLLLEDPEGEDDLPDMRVLADEYFRSYYRHFMNIIDQGGSDGLQTADGRRWMLQNLPGVDVQILMLEPLYGRLSDQAALTADEVRNLVAARPQSGDRVPELAFFGLDGLGVRLGRSWQR